MKQFWRIACQSQIVINALLIALMVGTLLNAVNHGEELMTVFRGGDGDLAWRNIVANYVIPYGVAVFSAAKNELDRITKP
jgi:hypothetical protein